MDTEALSYSRTKGIFAGVAVDGTVIQQDDDSTALFYGKNISFLKNEDWRSVRPSDQRLVFSEVWAAVNQANPHEAAEK